MRSVATICCIVLLSCSNARPQLTQEEREDCVLACANLRWMQCDMADEVKTYHSCYLHDHCDRGEYCSDEGQCVMSCESSCISARHRGKWADPACVRDAQECEDVDRCVKPDYQ